MVVENVCVCVDVYGRGHGPSGAMANMPMITATSPWIDRTSRSHDTERIETNHMTMLARTRSPTSVQSRQTSTTFVSYLSHIDSRVSWGHLRQTYCQNPAFWLQYYQ